jgi:hypothetical protein
MMACGIAHAAEESELVSRWIAGVAPSPLPADKLFERPAGARPTARRTDVTDPGNFRD